MKTSINHTFSSLLYLENKRTANFIEVLKGAKVIRVAAHEITYLEGEGNYTFVHTLSGRRYLISKTLKKVHAKLPHGFVRVHKSYTVNSDHVVAWLDPFLLLLSCGSKLPVARRRANEASYLLKEEYLRVG